MWTKEQECFTRGGTKERIAPSVPFNLMPEVARHQRCPRRLRSQLRSKPSRAGRDGAGRRITELWQYPDRRVLPALLSGAVLLPGRPRISVPITIPEIWLRFGLAVACGAPVFWFLSDESNPKVPFFGAFLVGITGSWLIMKVIALALPKCSWSVRQGERPPTDY